MHAHSASMIVLWSLGHLQEKEGNGTVIPLEKLAKFIHIFDGSFLELNDFRKEVSEDLQRLRLIHWARKERGGWALTQAGAEKASHIGAPTQARKILELSAD